jgi:hypothetical protein
MNRFSPFPSVGVFFLESVEKLLLGVVLVVG